MKRCKRCGACKECGSVPAQITYWPIYVQPAIYPVVTYPAATWYSSPNAINEANASGTTYTFSSTA